MIAGGQQVKMKLCYKVHSAGPASCVLGQCVRCGRRSGEGQGTGSALLK